MISPIYGDPGYEIQETIGPGKIDINIIISDYSRFLEKVLFIKKGGRIEISKMKDGNHLSIKIINRDLTQPSKMLGVTP